MEYEIEKLNKFAWMVTTYKMSEKNIPEEELLFDDYSTAMDYMKRRFNWDKFDVPGTYLVNNDWAVTIIPER